MTYVLVVSWCQGKPVEFVSKITSAQSDQSSLGAILVAKNPMLLYEDSAKSSLGTHIILSVLSCAGSVLYL